MENVNYWTLIVSILTLGVSIWVLILMIKSRRIKLCARLDKRSTSSSLGWEFEISNVGDVPVTLSQIWVSLHKSRKKERLWDWGTVRPLAEGAGLHLPYRLESRGTTKVRFTFHSGPQHQKEVAQIDKQGGGYLFIKTDCGFSHRQKFKFNRNHPIKS